MATTVIDSLLVTLGLDASKYSAGAKKVKREQEDLVKSGKRTDQEETRLQQNRDKRMNETAKGFKNLRNEVVAFGAVMLAGMGIKDFITNTINSAANLGYLSKNLSMSTQQIVAWQRAAERAGGSAGGMVAQFKESADTIAQLNSGMGPNEGLQWFFRLGGATSDLKNGNTYLLARAQIIQDAFKADPAQAALYAKQLGISEELFDFIKQGPQAINALVAAQEKNAAVSEKDAAAALELRNRYLDFRDSLISTATSIVLTLAPAISVVMEKFAQWAEKLSKNKEGIRTLGDNVEKFLTQTDWSAIISGAEKFAKAIGYIADGVASLSKDLRSVMDRWDEFTGKPKIQTPGVTKMPGAFRFGKTEDLNKDNAATGKPIVAPPAPTTAAGKAAKSISDSIEMGLARTLASLGHQASKEFVRDKMGVDLYGAGPKKTAPPAAALPKSSSNVPSNAQELMTEIELQYGLPSGLLDSVWKQESNRGQNMLSPAGARGHFQFMPKTAKEFGLKDPDDFAESADAAARKLQGLLKQYGGDLKMALAAYNWGQGNLGKYGVENAPKETRDYVKEIPKRMESARDAKAPSSATPTAATSTTDVRIDQINIHTQATDARGIASTIRPAVEQYAFANQANTGMS